MELERTETAKNTLTAVSTETNVEVYTARETTGRGVHQRRNGRNVAEAGALSGKSTTTSRMRCTSSVGGGEGGETIGVERLLFEQGGGDSGVQRSVLDHQRTSRG